MEKPSISIVLELAVLVVGVGVAWGSLHNEVATLKIQAAEFQAWRAQQSGAIYDIRERLIRIEDAIAVSSPDARRRLRAYDRPGGNK